MSPLEVQIVLHAFCLAEPFEKSGIHENAPAVRQFLLQFVVAEVLVPDKTRPCGYRLGGRGARWVYDILRTSP